MAQAPTVRNAPAKAQASVRTFTAQERETLRAELVEDARKDARIIGAAHTGSAAVGLQDRWSDVDLALCLAPDASVEDVMQSWSDRLYRDHGAVAHHDVRHGSTLFRVFLLRNTLQVDLAFWSSADFAPIGPKFKLIFGTPNPAPNIAAPNPGNIIGMAWLYALHVRSSIARNRKWQAEYMLSGLRNQLIELVCLRCNLPAVQGRGGDDLPENIKKLMSECLLRSLDPSELARAFRATVLLLLDEIGSVDKAATESLSAPLKTLIGFDDHEEHC